MIEVIAYFNDRGIHVWQTDFNPFLMEFGFKPFHFSLFPFHSQVSILVLMEFGFKPPFFGNRGFHKTQKS